jgi:hypothetical protein
MVQFLAAARAWLGLLLVLTACSKYGGGSAKPTDDADDDGYPDDEDCDSSDATVHPGADELCDEKDNDCDGEYDEDPIDGTTWYWDDDGDFFGDPAKSRVACQPESAWVPNGGDCDDTDPAINPDATEICDGIDQDCDGLIDDDDTDVDGQIRYWHDVDGDGYGDDRMVTTEACVPPADSVSQGGDCDDADPTVNPDADEVCDDAHGDEDCDGLLDEADDSLTDGAAWYEDADGDGWGTGEAQTGACEAPGGTASVDGDCDDGDAGVNPGVAEVCDEAAVDEDCDGLADDADDSVAGTFPWLADVDGDGWGDSAVVTLACLQPAGTAATGGDCDDADAAVNPDATEVCDEAAVDEDCDGLANDADPSVADATTWYVDADGDGYGDTAAVLCFATAGYASEGGDCDDSDPATHPGATEPCGSGDLDCDGAEWTCPPCSGSLSVSSAASAFEGDEAADFVGGLLLSTDDVDGDGDSDLIFAGYNLDSPDASDAGMVVQLLSPLSSGGSASSSADGALYGSTGHADVGKYGGYVGDIDGDGTGDLYLYATDEKQCYAVPLDVWATEPLSLGGTALGDDCARVTWLTGQGSTGYDAVVAANSAATTAIRVLDSDGVTELATWDRETGADGAGAAVAGGDDVDGDGVDDLVVGAPSVGGGEGRVYLLDGGARGTASLAAATWSDDGGGTTDALGSAAAMTGDLDGDGYADFLVGAPGVDGDAGEMVLYAGAGGGASEAASFHGPTDSRLGNAPPTAGDLDDDGNADLVLCAPSRSIASSNSYEGWCAVHYWQQAGGFAGALDADADATATIEGDAGWRLGDGARVAEDLTGDGAPDLVLAAEDADPNGNSSGAVYVFACGG